MRIIKLHEQKTYDYSRNALDLLDKACQLNSVLFISHELNSKGPMLLIPLQACCFR